MQLLSQKIYQSLFLTEFKTVFLTLSVLKKGHYLNLNQENAFTICLIILAFTKALQDFSK